MGEPITLWVAEWRPVLLNELLSANPMRRSGLKAIDYWMVRQAALAADATPARGKRRVEVTLVLPPGRCAPDVDSLWKSLLDVMVKNTLLVDDSPRFCEIAPLLIRRDLAWGTRIVLHDIEGDCP